MITFQKITWSNFLSTGQHPTTVNLDQSATTLIIGSNGAGKSTILDALTFSLYGKAFRKINKNQLINTTNEKNCLVVIEFNTNGIDWKVERGIKPNIFKIYRNGEELNQSYSAAEQQKWLEQTVLKMNYKSFTQIVILGSSTFVPFMQLPVSSRREVVEDLLDIKIFSSMNVIIKEKIRNIRDEVKTLDLKKISLKDKVDMQKNFIDEISSQSKKTINQKLKQLLTLMMRLKNLPKRMHISKKKHLLNQNMQEFIGARENSRSMVISKVSCHRRYRILLRNTNFSMKIGFALPVTSTLRRSLD